MTREEQLVYCKKCSNRKFDPKQGLICGITGEYADFDKTCENFTLDESIDEQAADVRTLSVEESQLMINKLKVHQDFYYATVGGLLVALISALIWAMITVATNLQIGLMAIAVGLFVGYSVRFFGAGLDKKFGFLGAFLSLLACILGNLFSQVGFIAEAESFGYFETLTLIDFKGLMQILIDSIQPLDFIFFGIAIFEGYRFAFRKITVEEINRLQSATYDGHPSNYKLRLPLVIISIVLMVFFVFKINKGASGLMTFKYESGNTQAKGELIDGQNHGKWTFWFENGNVQSIGNFSEGLKDGSWQWFEELGALVEKGNFKKGLEHGVWMKYYDDGKLIDSGSYIEGRRNGEWRFWFENGNLFKTGYYYRDRVDSIWKTYYEDGTLSSVEEWKRGESLGLWITYYSNGQAKNEINYLPNKKTSIKNAWDKEGNQIVKGGNGFYKSYSDNDILISQGNIEKGLQVGEWHLFYENGKVKEERTYEGEVYKMINSWDSKGKQNVIDGQGFYKSYYPDTEKVFETGKIENGLKAGIWRTYYETTEIVSQEINYVLGKQTGLQQAFFESGQLYSSGEMNEDIQEGEWTWYYENGNVLSTVKFVDGQKEGKQIRWTESGEKAKVEYYENGVFVEQELF